MRPRAAALLGLDDAALAVDRRRREADLAGDLAEQEQALVDARGLALGKVELVDGLGEFGAGIGVGAEAQAEPLQPMDELPLGDVG